MSDAIKRRVQNHPINLIENALKILDDPKLKISYEDRMAMVEPLVRAKIFGKGSGMKPTTPEASMAPAPQGNKNG